MLNIIRRSLTLVPILKQVLPDKHSSLSCFRLKLNLKIEILPVISEKVISLGAENIQPPDTFKTEAIRLCCLSSLRIFVQVVTKLIEASA